MPPKNNKTYTTKEENFMKEILEKGLCLSSDVFEIPVYTEIAIYNYRGLIYYFKIVTGKIVAFKRLDN